MAGVRSNAYSPVTSVSRIYCSPRLHARITSYTLGISPCRRPYWFSLSHAPHVYIYLGYIYLGIIKRVASLSRGTLSTPVVTGRKNRRFTTVVQTGRLRSECNFLAYCSRSTDPWILYRSRQSHCSHNIICGSSLQLRVAVFAQTLVSKLVVVVIYASKQSKPNKTVWYVVHARNNQTISPLFPHVCQTKNEI